MNAHRLWTRSRRRPGGRRDQRWSRSCETALGCGQRLRSPPELARRSLTTAYRGLAPGSLALRLSVSAIASAGVSFVPIRTPCLHGPCQRSEQKRADQSFGCEHSVSRQEKTGRNEASWKASGGLFDARGPLITALSRCRHGFESRWGWLGEIAAQRPYSQSGVGVGAGSVPTTNLVREIYKEAEQSEFDTRGEFFQKVEDLMNTFQPDTPDRG